MLKISVLAVIGARLNSSRLPKKHLLTLAGQPMIARIFQRIEKIPEISYVTVATTSDNYNQPLVDWAVTAGKNVDVYDGDVNDLVGRVNAVVEQRNPDFVVYLCGDSPLIEPSTVSRMIAALMTSTKADIVKLEATADAKAYIHEGFSIYRRSVWDRIVSASITPQEKEHVGVALNRFSHQLTTVEVAEDPVYATLQHRISVDTVSDYQFMQTVYRQWYCDHPQDSIVELRWVIELLQKNPQLQLLNAHVQQKSIAETARRILLVTQAGKASGLGQLTRSIILTQALQEIAKANVTLLIVGDKFDLPELSFISHEFCPDSRDFNTSVLDSVERIGPETVIFDAVNHYNNDYMLNLLQQLRDKSLNLIAVDGMLRCIDQLDLVYIPSFYLDPEYSGPAYQHKIMHGWNTYLLKKPPHTEKWQKGNNAIVLTGGSDTTCLAHRLPSQLDEHLPDGTAVHWIKGPFAASPVIPSEARLHWTVHHAPSDIYPIASQMNYAISVYGVSFFEMLQLGLPCVVFNPYDIGSREMEILKTEKLALVADNEMQAVSGLAELMENNALSGRLALRAKNAITCSGVTDFVKRVVALS